MPALGLGLSPGFLTSQKAAYVWPRLPPEGGCADEAEASSESGAAEADGAEEAPGGRWGPMGAWTRRCCGQERVYGMGTRAANTNMSA